MNRQTVINRLARMTYRPKTEDDDDYAVQLFIEKIILPADSKCYTEEQIANYIDKFLNNTGVKWEK
jgi:hypothetical protein